MKFKKNRIGFFYFSLSGLGLLFLGLPVLAFGEWKQAKPMSPSAKATEYAGIALTPESAEIVPKSKHRNALPDSFMRPYQLKEMGLSSAVAPEKYERTVMFSIPKDLVEKYGEASSPVCHVDNLENVYLTFKRAVVMFDKSGKVVREILKGAEQQNGLLVDEKENICIYSAYAPSDFWIYDARGQLVVNSNFVGLRWDEPIYFSNGILYTKDRTLYKIQGGDEKTERKNSFQDLKFNLTGDRPTRYETDENNNWVPGRIDGFNFERIVDVDSSGNVYAEYQQYSPVGDQPSWVLSRLYKFNSKFRLLAGFDFYPNDINLKTGSLYHLEGLGYGQVVKWEKTNKK